MLGGLALLPDLSGALYVPDYETLIIADLHLEQGSSLARRGLYVPPFDTAVTLQHLETVVANIRPRHLIFLGDSFHDGAAELRLAQAHLESLCRITANHETTWLSGNHDPHPPQSLGGVGAESLSLGPLTLRHEPIRNLDVEFEIAGHLHPGCGISQRGRHMRGKCFVSDAQRLIMPAFGAYTGGLAVSSKAFHGMFDDKASAWMLGRTAIHKFALAKVS